MVIARKYIVIRRFKEIIQDRHDFIIMVYDLPSLTEGQILVKVEWISLDPYLHSYGSRHALPYDQFGYQIGIVEYSKNKEYPVGTRVVSHQGWCDYCVLDPTVQVKSIDATTVNYGVYKLPDLRGLPIYLGIGTVGMPGVAAYFGLLEVCKPRPGETVVVTGAADAVGSTVGQIAKIKGCRAIGFTDSDEKVNWLKKELGFDEAYNYKAEDIDFVLKEGAPHGIDCFFDNVGGELSYVIMKQMNNHGRVAICGSMSVYDESHVMSQPDKLQPTIMIKQLVVEGFHVFRWIKKWPEAFTELTEWIRNGDLKATEYITEGFNNIVRAFQSMQKGEHLGKGVVKIA